MRRGGPITKNGDSNQPTVMHDDKYQSFEDLFTPSRKIEQAKTIVDENIQLHSFDQLTSSVNLVNVPGGSYIDEDFTSKDIEDYLRQLQSKKSKVTVPARNGIYTSDDAAKMDVVLPIFDASYVRGIVVSAGVPAEEEEKDIYDSNGSGVVRGRCLLLTQYLKQKVKEKGGSVA